MSSRTRSDNHTTRPASPVVLVNIMKYDFMSKNSSLVIIATPLRRNENQILENEVYQILEMAFAVGRDRIRVSTLRCGRNNPGSNPGHGK